MPADDIEVGDGADIAALADVQLIHTLQPSLRRATVPGHCWRGDARRGDAPVMVTVCDRSWSPLG
jgi:hypothetical protein